MIGINPFLANVHHWATVQPTATALVWRGHRVSFETLWYLVKNTTEHINALSLPPRGVLAVSAQKSPRVIALLLALRHLYHPVLIVPEQLGAEARHGVYEHANAYAELSAGYGTDAPQPHIAIVNETASLNANENVAMILTTSGSTGIPKGVRLSGSAITNFFRWAQAAFSIQPGTTVLSYAPLNFDLSLLEVWAALDAGATVVLVDADQAADAKALQKLVSQHNPDLMQGVPLLYKLLLQQPTLPFRPDAHIIVTGEPTPRELRQSLADAFPAARFHNVYGSTETNNSFMFSVSAAEFAGLANVPIGNPIAGTCYRIVNDSGEALIGLGRGELHTSTPFAALGYTDARLDDLAFYEHEGRRYYCTGDIAERHADGCIHLA
ncbi:MAG: AMP-binding protein, partial [Rhodomicrobium sp.]|nr:AMP-binding protein [Rhodomicrobium sp.]